MSIRFLALIVGIACSQAGRVCAEASSPALHWSRAENAADCVDPRTLAELVESYTGPVLVAPGTADESIEGEIERTGSDVFRVRLSLTVARGRPVGERVLSLQAADCRKLDGTIALVIATTLNPDLGAGKLPSELSWLKPSERTPAEQLREELASAPPAEPRQLPQPLAAGATDAVAPGAPPQSEDPDPSPRRTGWELGIAATAGTGVVPKANAGGLVTFARTLGSWFGLTMQLRGNASLGGFDVMANRRVAVETFGGALLACGRAGNERAFAAQACLGPEVGLFRAHGTGFDAAHTILQPVYGGHVKLELRYEIADKLSITAAGLLGLGFRRPTVFYWVLEEQRLLFRSELYSIQGALGLTRTF